MLCCDSARLPTTASGLRTVLCRSPTRSARDLSAVIRGVVFADALLALNSTGWQRYSPANAGRDRISPFGPGGSSAAHSRTIVTSVVNSAAFPFCGCGTAGDSYALLRL